MGKSLTHKIAKTKVATPDQKNDKLKQLSKPKKTASSIRKEKDAKKGDLDELKQLLNLEPPKLNLELFANTLNFGDK